MPQLVEQRILEAFSATVSTRLEVIKVVIDQDRTITEFDVYLGVALPSGTHDASFNVRVNGVSQFTYPNYLKILAGARSGSKTGLSIPVVKGDIVDLDYLGDVPGGLGSFLTWIFVGLVGGVEVPGGGTTGQVLTKESNADGDYDWETPVTGATDLDGLSDVVITTPTNDDILQRKAGSFVNRSLAQLKTDLAYDLDALSDVIITSVANGDFLERVGGNWVNRTSAQVLSDLGIGDAMIFKGVIDCSANPNYPAADAGHEYKVSVAGRIGGGSGPVVEVGDALICAVDGTSSGTQAGVGANWFITQVNINGAVVGPASVTDDLPAIFDGTTGKLIKSKTYAAFKALLLLVAGDVGLGNVDNTSDATKNAASATLTNKTIDPEGTGNAIGEVEKIWIPAAGTNGTTPAPVWDLPSSGAPTATDVTGTNIHKGVLSFADSGLQTAQMTLLLPGDWSGALDIKILWYTTATSGNCKWQVSTAFTDTGASATDDPSFNTAQTVTTAAPGTGSRITSSSITGLTNTGSAAGALMHIKVGRDGTDGSDTIGAAALFIGAEITMRRTV